MSPGDIDGDKFAPVWTSHYLAAEIHWRRQARASPAIARGHRNPGCQNIAFILVKLFKTYFVLMKSTGKLFYRGTVWLPWNFCHLSAGASIPLKPMRQTPLPHNYHSPSFLPSPPFSSPSFPFLSLAISILPSLFPSPNPARWVWESTVATHHSSASDSIFDFWRFTNSFTYLLTYLNSSSYSILFYSIAGQSSGRKHIFTDLRVSKRTSWQHLSASPNISYDAKCVIPT